MKISFRVFSPVSWVFSPVSWVFPPEKNIKIKDQNNKTANMTHRAFLFTWIVRQDLIRIPQNMDKITFRLSFQFPPQADIWGQAEIQALWKIQVSIYLSDYLSIKLSLYVSVYLSICLSIYLSIYLSISLCLSVCLSVYLPDWKRSSSARLPHFSNLTTSKTEQFCDTSFIFQPNNVQNRSNSARLPQCLNLTTSKQSNSARLPSKMESWVQRWEPRTNAFCDLSTPPV